MCHVSQQRKKLALREKKRNFVFRDSSTTCMDAFDHVMFNVIFRSFGTPCLKGGPKLINV